MNEKYTVFSLRVANQLVNQGFKVIGTGVNLQKPQYKVFFFENTEELRAAVDKITASI